MSQACSICQSKDTSQRISYTDLDRWEKASGITLDHYIRSWIICNNCGAATRILDPLSAEKLSRLSSSYYKIDFQKAEVFKKYERILGLPKMQSDNYWRVLRILSFLQSPTGSHFLNAEFNVLDIGAGLGIFLTEFQQQFSFDIPLNLAAIEPDPLAFSCLSSLNFIKSYNTDLAEFNLDFSPSLITCNKVLEHIADPISFLSELSNLCSDSTLLYIEVPDIETFNYRDKGNGILGSFHANIYSSKSLSLLLDNINFKVLQTGTVSEPSGKISLYSIACSKSFLSTLFSEV